MNGRMGMGFIFNKLFSFIISMLSLKFFVFFIFQALLNYCNLVGCIDCYPFKHVIFSFFLKLYLTCILPTLLYLTFTD